MLPHSHKSTSVPFEQLQPHLHSPSIQQQILIFFRCAKAEPVDTRKMSIAKTNVVLATTAPVLPPQYSSRLFRSSFTTCFSVYLAAKNELWYCAAMAFLVLVTSLNYWRHPVIGWRRTVDMGAVFLGMMYHIYCSSYVANRMYQVFYLMFILKTAYCYMRARDAPNKDVSSAWHCGVHIMGNLGNMLLYTGLAV